MKSASIPSIVKEYYNLTKPGLVRGNLIIAAAGFLFASRMGIDFSLLFYFLLAVSLIIASACICNNVMDIEIDSKMARTRSRGIVSGRIPVLHAVVFGILLAIGGFVILGLVTNLLTVFVGTVGWVMYTVVYGYAKRHTIHSTLIGAIPGAMPILAGYTAVTGSIDIIAFLLFLSLVWWQMVHFYAIALYRRDEYAAAGLPLLSVVRSTQRVYNEMLAYVVLFLGSIVIIGYQSGVSLTYTVLAAAVGAYWLVVVLRKFEPIESWARRVFGISLLIIIAYSIILSADGALL